MNAVDNNNYVWVFNQDTFKVTCTGTAAFSFMWDVGMCYRELGWNPVNTTASTSQTAPNALQLDLPHILYLYIPEIGVFVRSTRTNCNGTFTIFVSANPTENNFRIAGEYEQVVQTNIASLTKLSVSLRYQNGKIVDLNGSDWSFTLELNS